MNKFLRHLATRVEKIENSSKQQEEVVKTLLDADWNAGGLEFHSSFDNGPMDSGMQLEIITPDIMTRSITFQIICSSWKVKWQKKGIN